MNLPASPLFMRRGRIKGNSGSPENRPLLRRGGADSRLRWERPLYLRLCRNQKSFRARLTPKPWRCGHHAPSERWPFLDAKTEKRFELWETEYLRRIREYSVVRLLERVGSGQIHPEIEPLLAWHDQIGRADRTDLLLA